MRARFLIAAVFAASFVSVSANAGATIDLTLDVSIADDGVDYALCEVSVPALGSDGFTVLDAAVSAGCIESYEAVDFGAYGRFLTCIDGVCGQDAPTWALPVPVAYVGTQWAFTVNDAEASVGLDSYIATNGDEVGLTYVPYAFTA